MLVVVAIELPPAKPNATEDAPRLVVPKLDVEVSGSIDAVPVAVPIPSICNPTPLYF
jgi:hypothetical protein